MRPSSQARHWVLQSWCHNSAALHTQPNPTPSLCSALSEPEWPQQANSCVTACQSKHVCSDAQACGRVAEVDSQIKCQMRESYVVPRHFVSLSVSLRFAHCIGYLAMFLILWCPHTDIGSLARHQSTHRHKR